MKVRTSLPFLSVPLPRSLVLARGVAYCVVVGAANGDCVDPWCDTGLRVSTKMEPLLPRAMRIPVLRYVVSTHPVGLNKKGDGTERGGGERGVSRGLYIPPLALANAMSSSPAKTKHATKISNSFFRWAAGDNNNTKRVQLNRTCSQQPHHVHNHDTP